MTAPRRVMHVRPPAPTMFQRTVAACGLIVAGAAIAGGLWIIVVLFLASGPA